MTLLSILLWAIGLVFISLFVGWLVRNTLQRRQDRKPNLAKENELPDDIYPLF